MVKMIIRDIHYEFHYFLILFWMALLLKGMLVNLNMSRFDLGKEYLEGSGFTYPPINSNFLKFFKLGLCMMYRIICLI